MRRSHRTNSLVIISDHTKSLYEDKWIGAKFHYTGMGKKGDQDLNFAQNKTLAESNENKVEVYLFEVFKPKEYIFLGQVYLTSVPYQEKQFDEDNIIRNVWVFPLKLMDSKKFVVDKELIEAKEEIQGKIASRLSDEEIAKKAELIDGKTSTRTVTTTTYERNQLITEYAKRWANGICQLCEKPAPFKNKKGEPFLETHHVDWLARSGMDSIYNTIALCPNCHKKMHIVDNNEDVKNLKKKIIDHIKK
ncbi:HNH endonuclease [Metabacillus sp. KUDC1714]|uniref:HNH endonuclease n=2 Tax=Metabacillus elymi TaxID=2745198 RepID=A0ABX6SGN2_9BACI|nr:HNH endonuclease [Metabacillus sp. KUDC1714]